jgi:hypothetical protein
MSRNTSEYLSKKYLCTLYNVFSTCSRSDRLRLLDAESLRRGQHHTPGRTQYHPRSNNDFSRWELEVVAWAKRGVEGLGIDCGPPKPKVVHSSALILSQQRKRARQSAMPASREGRQQLDGIIGQMEQRKIRSVLYSSKQRSLSLPAYSALKLLTWIWVSIHYCVQNPQT